MAGNGTNQALIDPFGVVKQAGAAAGSLEDTLRVFEAVKEPFKEPIADTGHVSQGDPALYSVDIHSTPNLPDWNRLMRNNLHAGSTGLLAEAPPGQ